MGDIIGWLFLFVGAVLLAAGLFGSTAAGIGFLSIGLGLLVWSWI